MIDCYFIGVCEGSALDRDTNNLSLFGLIEELQVPTEALGAVVPLQCHFYLATSKDAIGQPIEARVLWKRQDGSESHGANVFSLVPDALRVRNRATALQLPTAFGDYRLFLEWREPGAAEWARSTCGWPFQVIEQPEKSTPPTSTP